MLNTTSRLHRKMLWCIIPAKPINDAIITTSNISREINYQKQHSICFLHRVIVHEPVFDPFFTQRLAIRMRIRSHGRYMMVPETSQTTNFHFCIC